MTLRSATAACLVLLPSWARAESATANAGSLVQVVVGLGVVLVLMLGTLWLLKRVSAPRGAAAGMLKVVTAAAVGARERVVVVEVGDTWLVLGVAPGRVTALHQMPRQALPPGTAPANGEFAARLRQFMDRSGSAR